MDEGHELTEELLADLERRVHSAYNAAHGDLETVIADYFANFEKRDKEMLALLNEGKISEEKYKQWRLAQMGRGERYKALQKKIADRMLNANQTAVAYMNDATPGIYSLNYNYSAYTIEQANEGIDFTLFDEQTVRRLVADDPELWPRPRIDIPADLLWNKNNVRNAITSGILLGESIGKIASRLERVTDMNRNAAIRNARTAVTGAQNAGRQASYERAAEMGIRVAKEWKAVHDFRTRHSHAELDGKRVPFNEKFHSILGSEMMYPGDKNGKPADVYNCRCTMDYVDPLSDKRETYNEWFARKEKADPDGVRLEIRKIRNESSDREQYARYYDVVKTKAGKTFADFQAMKYTDPEKWKYIKLDYSRRNKLIKHPELALPNSSSAVIANEKFTKYLFNPDNKNGWAKGQAMSARLGYSLDNWETLQKEILQAASRYPATAKGNSGYGERFEQRIVFYGVKGTPANVVVGWIQREDGAVSLTSAHIKEVE